MLVLCANFGRSKCHRCFPCGAVVLLLSLVSAGYAHAGYLDPVYTVQTQTDIVYYHDIPTDTDLLMDTLVPVENPATNKPGVVLFHGNGINKTIMWLLARPLAERGFACFCANWQTTSDYQQNVIEAVRWVRTHAATYGVAPNRIGALGHSYGSSMTGILATADFVPPEAKVQAGVMLAGQLFYIDDCDSGDAPVAFITGTEDSYGAYERALDAVVKFKTVDLPYAFFPIVGADHYSIMLPDLDVCFGRTNIEIISEFLANYLLGESESTMAALHVTAPADRGAVELQPLNAFYPKGTQVTLDASPLPGGFFLWWQGDVLTGDNPLTLTMNSNKHVEAVFSNIGDTVYLLDTWASDYGRVDLSPPGGSYVAGTIVTATAVALTPFEELRFDHWEGDLSGSANVVQITMDRDRTIGAVFGKGLPVKVPLLSLSGLAVLALVLGYGATRSAPRREGGE